MIPLKNGEQVLWTNGKKHFTVPKMGGVFYPKKSAENQDLNTKRCRYHAKGIEDAIDFYNKEEVERHNDKLADMKIAARKKSWWQVWK